MKTSHSRFRMHWIVAIVLANCFVPGVVNAHDAPDIDEIWRVINRRQQRTETLIAEVQRTETLFLPGSDEDSIRELNLSVKRTVAIDRLRELLDEQWAGQRYQYELDTVVTQTRRRQVFEGQHRSWSGPAREVSVDKLAPMGVISSWKHPTVWYDTTYGDWFHELPYGLSREFFVPGSDSADIEISPEPVDFEGTPCIVIRIRRGLLTEWVWLDPQREYLPLGRRRDFGKDFRETYRLSYELRDGEWVPVAYDDSQIKRGKPLRRVRGEIRKFERNVSIDPQYYAWEFPDGTWVGDYTVDRSSPEMNYVWLDGEKRPLPGADASLPYSEMLENLRTQRDEGVRFRWSYLIAGLAVATVLGFVIFRFQTKE